MISEVIYGSDGWDIIIRNLWNRSKAINMDFRGVSDANEFIERVLGKEAFDTKSMGSDYKKNPLITRAGIITINDDMEWILSDIATSYLDLVESIREFMKEHNEITILIGAERFKDEMIQDIGFTLERITVKK